MMEICERCADDIEFEEICAVLDEFGYEMQLCPQCADFVNMELAAEQEYDL